VSKYPEVEPGPCLRVEAPERESESTHAVVVHAARSLIANARPRVLIFECLALCTKPAVGNRDLADLERGREPFHELLLGCLRELEALDARMPSLEILDDRITDAGRVDEDWVFQNQTFNFPDRHGPRSLPSLEHRDATVVIETADDGPVNGLREVDADRGDRVGREIGDAPLDRVETERVAAVVGRDAEELLLEDLLR
jgi:hypothetical protein